MKIEKMDLFDSTSLTTILLNQIRDKRDALRKEADRINEVYNMLINQIARGDITNTEDIDAAISWINHSNLTPIEIITVIKEGK